MPMRWLQEKLMPQEIDGVALAQFFRDDRRLGELQQHLIAPSASQ